MYTYTHAHSAAEEVRMQLNVCNLYIHIYIHVFYIHYYILLSIYIEIFVDYSKYLINYFLMQNIISFVLFYVVVLFFVFCNLVVFFIIVLKAKLKNISKQTYFTEFSNACEISSNDSRKNINDCNNKKK